MTDFATGSSWAANGQTGGSNYSTGYAQDVQAQQAWEQERQRRQFQQFSASQQALQQSLGAGYQDPMLANSRILSPEESMQWRALRNQPARSGPGALSQQNVAQQQQQLMGPQMPVQPTMAANGRPFTAASLTPYESLEAKAQKQHEALLWQEQARQKMLQG